MVIFRENFIEKIKILPIIYDYFFYKAIFYDSELQNLEELRLCLYE